MATNPVRSIDAAHRHVELASGERIAYDRLLLATGAAPRRLPLPGENLDGIHCLRTRRDAEVLAAAARAEHVVVVGTGWIGSEAAASLRQLGREITLLGPGTAPLARVLGPEVADVYRDLHADHDVRLALGTRVAGFRGADGVLAAGDAAAAWHPRYQRYLRVEHWANAVNQSPAAARGMLGIPTSYQRLPYFYSDQYDPGMEYSGLAATWDEVVVRGDPATHAFLAFWLKDGRVVAGMHANVWDVTEAIQTLIRGGRPVDPARLADPGIPAKAIGSSADYDGQLAALLFLGLGRGGGRWRHA